MENSKSMMMMIFCKNINFCSAAIYKESLLPPEIPEVGRRSPNVLLCRCIVYFALVELESFSCYIYIIKPVEDFFLLVLWWGWKLFFWVMKNFSTDKFIRGE